MLLSHSQSARRIAFIACRHLFAIVSVCLLCIGLSSTAVVSAASLDISQSPLFLTEGQTPLVLLTMARDHKLYYEAYNDYSDLDGDGSLDVGYKPSIDYYGYFDSHKCYIYSESDGRFTPSSATISDTKKCSGKWSGDFLNYVTMARIDALRKVLYGGYRSTDTSSLTVLERSFIPQDAHSWGKEYQSVARDGYDISDYTPLSLPVPGTYHLFANTTLTSDASPPLMRVLTNTNYRIWEWLSIERPVAGSECATGNNSRANCAKDAKSVWEIVPASYLSAVTQTIYNTGNQGAPTSKSAYNTLENGYAKPANLCGSRSVSQINGSGNPFAIAPCNVNGDGYLDIFEGTINIPADGTYTFAVDGDDAVDMAIDGTKIASWYDGHGACNCTDHSHDVTLTAGAHTLKFRHQDATGGDEYHLYWKRTIPASTMTDYNVRVEVCSSTVSLESNCHAYGSSNKPVGLLQNEGENDGMYFGLLTGSYKHNTEGGVLRKEMSSINNEITSDGRFGATADDCLSGTKCVNGIISTLNKLKITGFDYGSHTYSCGWIDTRQMEDGECEMWGNPVGEMVYEGMRYFSGATSPTPAFSYAANDGNITDNVLGLPQITAWHNPYSSEPDPADSPATFASCSKPYSLLVSDVYPSFDSNSVPGNPFFTFASDLSEMDVSKLGQTIWEAELGKDAKNIFIGQSGNVYDGAPTAKSASSFGNIRGLAPGEPTRQGSYYAAAAAYYGHTHDLNPITGSQKLNTYSIALAAPLPNLEIPVGTNQVKVLPFAKSVAGSSIASDSGSFQPTNQIVDFYVDTIRNVTGSPTDAAVNDGRPYYKFRINYEDTEQGADHDMDAVGLYEIKLNEDDTVSISISSDYAAGGITQHMGFVISGTTHDGAYLLVRDSDTAAGDDPAYFLDCRSATVNPADCVSGSGALPLFKELKFSSSSDGSASLLKDPLWYAAKWGNFFDENSNQLPDSTEWDADSDGIPDNYFLVTNPLKLETQLTKALGQIKSDAATAAATSTNSFSYRTDSVLYQARFTNDGWSGELNALSIKANGSLGAAAWQAQYTLADMSSSDRVILTYDPGNAVTKGIKFQWESMTGGNPSFLQDSLNKNYAGTVDDLGSDRVSYLRGNAVAGMRTRPYIKNTTIINKLGDIVDSQPQYVAAPDFGYPDETYASFRAANLDRTPMVYDGANDGMLHGFSAADGTEKIAYIPSEMYRTRNGQPLLSKLTASNYGKEANPHHYYVDGTPTVADVCTAACEASNDGTTTDWKTILVGGLNSGGQGVYALDITDPDDFTEDNASSLVMWEFNDRQDTDNDSTMQYGLGYTYSRPSVVRICTDRGTPSDKMPGACSAGKWVVIFGNGYNNTEDDGYASTSGYASLYILDALTGAVIKKISTQAGSTDTPNGLGTVNAVDVDGDDYADYVYAGDLLGNIWKFDLSSDTTSDWASAYSAGGKPAPLYTAKSDDGDAQKITTAPYVIFHPDSGVMVLFGTGSYLASSDKKDKDQQSVYGIWDDGESVSSSNRSNLVEQTVNTNTAEYESDHYRTISANSIDWTTKKGWYIDLPDSGERISFDSSIFDNVVTFTSTVPSTDICEFGGSSWNYYVDATTGGRLSYSIFDGVPMLDFGGFGSYASISESTIGISPPGPLIHIDPSNFLPGADDGTGSDDDTGSAGNTGSFYKDVTVQSGSTGGSDSTDIKRLHSSGRLSWREILSN